MQIFKLFRLKAGSEFIAFKLSIDCRLEANWKGISDVPMPTGAVLCARKKLE